MTETEPAAGLQIHGAAILIVPDGHAAVVEAARLLAVAISSAVAARGRAHIALTGGSTAAPLYRELTGSLRAQVPWDRTHCWWGDDRFVPRDHPLSNMFAADRILLGRGGAPIPGVNVHPIPCTVAVNRGLDAAWAAGQYAAELRSTIPLEDGQPIFDVILVGVGPDGHLLSVFPGSPAFETSEPVVAVPAPVHIAPHVPRVTLNPAALDVARSVLVVATGAGKSRAVGSILAGVGDGREPTAADAIRMLPARAALRPGATWILDVDAAAGLHRPAVTSSG